MMASRIVSRLLPVAEGDSMFDGSRLDPDLDLESQRRADYGRRYQPDDDDDDPEAMFYEPPSASTPFRDNALSPETRPLVHGSLSIAKNQPTWFDGQQRRRKDEEEEEDVPESLLLERKGKPTPKQPSVLLEEENGRARTEEQWNKMQQQHKLHSSNILHLGRNVPARPGSESVAAPPLRSSPQANAMWTFTNAPSLDAFLQEAYQYFTGHGMSSILLAKFLTQATELFAFCFAMFLTTCIDYSKIPTSKKTPDVLIPQCIDKSSWIKKTAIFLFVIYWGMMFVRNLGDISRLRRMRDFYTHILEISEDDMQTVSWLRVVDGLVKVQNANVATANNGPRAKRYLDYNQPQQRITAETVANRLMRQDNYYVALFNKEIFDFTLPVPYLGSRLFYSKSLEWCIDFCLTNFVFDEQGAPRPFALDVKNRKVLVEGLRRRLRFAALVSVLFAPWNMLRFSIVYFFRYYTEFTRNPARVSLRAFTPFAEWKIREFNELEHLFQRRIRQAYPFAVEYLKQFPKDKTDQLCRFVAFVSGAFAGVLALATLFDSELFLGFEITEGRTTVFWVSVMVGIFSVAHGALPDETETHDPVLHLKEVLMYIHYMPAHWKDRLHSNEVRAEFSSLYQNKVLIFLEEIISLVLTPIILYRNSNERCERIVDFFRESTVHVEGVGNQCNFAVFNFNKHQNVVENTTTALQEPDGLRDDYFGLKDDKMAASIHNFAQYYSAYNQRQNGRRPLHGYQRPPEWPPLSPPTVAEEIDPARSLFKPSAQHTARQPGLASSQRRDPRSPQSLAHDRRRRPARHAEADISRPQQPSLGPSESRIMALDSDLDDYDRAVGRDASGLGLESDTDAEDGAKGGGDGKEGVLGLLAQFTKAKTEKGIDI
jgi:autophagy-related protein 9